MLSFIQWKTTNRNFSSDPNESWSSIRYSTSAIHFNGSSSFILNQFPGSTCVTLRVLKLLLDRKPIRNRVLYFKHSFLQIAMYISNYNDHYNLYYKFMFLHLPWLQPKLFSHFVYCNSVYAIARAITLVIISILYLYFMTTFISKISRGWYIRWVSDFFYQTYQNYAQQYCTTISIMSSSYVNWKWWY